MDRKYDGLDDLFISDDDEDENLKESKDLEETLYEKSTYVGVSTGEKICSDSKLRCFRTSLVQKLNNVFSVYISSW